MPIQLPSAIVPALEASGFAGTWDWNVTTGEVRLDPRSAEMVAGDASLAEQIITLDQALHCLHHDDRIRVMAEIAKVGRLGGRFSAEYRIQMPSGEVRWVLDRGRVTHQADGTLRGYGTWIDITESRQIVERRDLVHPLEVAVDHCIIAHGEIHKAGTSALCSLADILLFELGQTIAHLRSSTKSKLH